MFRRVASVLIVVGLMAPWASAQSFKGQPASKPQGPLFPPIPTDPAHPDYYAPAAHSILRLSPLPRPRTYRAHYSSPGRTSQGRSASTQGESGFANPGGVGRNAEFYTPNTPISQVDQHPVPVGRHDQGGGLTYSDQISAAQAGQQRAKNIQDNINVYGRPYGAFGAGFGYGLGLSGGLLYNFPF